jgi:hypothetical protein
MYSSHDVATINESDGCIDISTHCLYIPWWIYVFNWLNPFSHLEPIHQSITGSGTNIKVNEPPIQTETNRMGCKNVSINTDGICEIEVSGSGEVHVDSNCLFGNHLIIKKSGSGFIDGGDSSPDRVPRKGGHWPSHCDFNIKFIIYQCVRIWVC